MNQHTWRGTFGMAWRTAALAAGGLFALSASELFAATNTFTGTGGWTDAARWSPAPPVNGDTVIVNGACSNTASTEILDSYTLNASRTHTFYGTNSCLRATNITINGTLTHGTNTATNAIGGVWYPDNRLWLVAYSNLTLAANGTINANEKGYRGETNSVGYGPGGGGIASGGGGGGGYGGYGQTYSGVGGLAYGSSNAPADPGSAGGSPSASRPGYAGGGAIRIQAGGLLTIDGSVTANGGANGGYVYLGGGSGGGIWIECGAIAGAGLVQAKGGGGYISGGGGGGRIAVNISNDALQQSQTPAIRFQALQGIGDSAYNTVAEAGTLYFPDTRWFPWRETYGGFRFCVPATNWSADSLTVSNALLQFPDGFRLTLTNTLKVHLSGGISILNGGQIVCGGLVLSNSGSLRLQGAQTNGGAPDYGALLRVSSNITVASNSTLYLCSHPTNGGSVLVEAGNVYVWTNSQINADGLGYASATNKGAYGPGRGGWFTGNGRGGGGGYGGRGGDTDADTGNGGQTYGSSNAPMDPGSAGSADNVTYMGGAGGGLVRINAPQGIVHVDGLISANGISVSGVYKGGGSGGGVFIICRALEGAGTIRAMGGSANWGGGGGGGRIAIWRMYDRWQGTPFSPITNVVAGLPGGGGDGSQTGAVGTVYFHLIQPPGTVFSFH